MTSARAGLLTTSRAFRSVHLPEIIAANLPLKKRERGFTEAQMVESVVLLQTAGGDCPEDIKFLHGDECLERGLGYALPKVTALRTVSMMSRWKRCGPNARSKRVSFCPAVSRCRGCSRSRRLWSGG